MNIQKLIKGGAWFLGFSILAKIVAFFNVVYLTRMLSVVEYGLFVSMFSIFGIILTFTSLGLNSSMLKFIPHYKIKKQYGKIRSVLISILQFEFIMRFGVFIILIFISPWLAEHYFKTDSTFLFRWFSILLITELMYRNLKPFYKSFKNTIMLGLMEFIIPVLYGICFIIFFRISNGVMVPVISYLLVSFIISIVFSLVALKTFDIFKYQSVNKKKIFKKMLIFGIPLVVANTGGVFISFFDTIMLTSLSTLDQVGIYNITLSSALILSFMFNALSITLIPTVSELNAVNKQKDIFNGLKKIYKYSIMFLIPIVLIGVLLAKPVLSFVYGNEYGVGYWAFRILLVGMIFVVLNNYNTRVLIGTGKTMVIAKITWFSAILNIILNIPFIYYWGIIGAAIATSTSYLCQMILSIRQIRKSLGDNNV